MWLPEKVSWSDLEDSEGRVYAKASQLYAALPCTLCLLLVRFLFERYLATPLADLWGVRDHVRLTAETHPVLEKHFCSQARVLSQDFKEQVTHHIATLTLLSFSWISNYIRIGTLVMACHDSADILLEVDLTVTTDGRLHFGDVVMLVNMGGEERDCSALSINADVNSFNKIPTPGIISPCGVVAGRGIQACPRTSFIIT
ncbi:hypothetical protein KUCAC02_021463, partial [Chaenocephalus aceratus]